jgi:hypothetical protein|tara:strand:+ start:5284 stop:5823 length:540 start_codon:yes stop_codon:yes gene_type:complete
MIQTFKIKGKIVFDPPNITSKHEKQSKWKKVAMLEFDGDIKGYYRWFVKKRYNLFLGESIRKAHITFINDHKRDFKDFDKWNEVKKKWNGKSIEIELSTDVRSDGINWWLVIPEEARGGLHGIRAELGLGRPYFGLHMTFGVARDAKDDVFEMNTIRAVRQNEAHSRYIVDLLKEGFIK